MTSKEALSELTLFLNKLDVKGEAFESYKKIKKDLNVLEVLKKIVNIKLEQQDDYYFAQVGQEPLKNIDEEDYISLKEWLNERN